MSSISTFLGFIVLCGAFGNNCSNPNKPLDIWCLKDHVKNQTNLIGRFKNTSLCTAKTITKYPFNLGEHDITPAAPENMSSEVKVYRTSDNIPTKQIAIYVSWLYRKDYFEHVESYHIEMISIVPYGLVEQYLIEWNDELEDIINGSTATLLRFNFIYSGRPEDYHIDPATEYYFRIMPVPIHKLNETPQDVRAFVTIPGCTNREIKRTHFCMTRPCDKKGRVRIAGKCIRYRVKEKNETN